METLQVAIESRDGHALSGIAMVPAAEGAFPRVGMLHGFGGSVSGCKYFNTYLARYLAREGVARAEDDKLVSSEDCERYQAIYQSASYMQIPAGGHDFANLEARAAVFDAVTEFVKSHS